MNELILMLVLLAAFMTGLALGAWLSDEFERVMRRRRVKRAIIRERMTR